MVTIFKNHLWDEKANSAVTIITPVFNRTKLLPRALKSVEKQTFRDFELIVIDDGSTDDIDEFMISYLDCASYPVLYIKKHQGGYIQQEIWGGFMQEVNSEFI